MVGERHHGAFPLATFLINVSGAFVIGFLSVLFGVDWHGRRTCRGSLSWYSLAAGLVPSLRELLMLGLRSSYDIFRSTSSPLMSSGRSCSSLAAALHARKRIGDLANSLVGTGICGGLTTFSSFVYATVVLVGGSMQSATVGAIYVGVSLVFGYLAVRLGLRLGGSAR